MTREKSANLGSGAKSEVAPSVTAPSVTAPGAAATCMSAPGVTATLRLHERSDDDLERYLLRVLPHVHITREAGRGPCVRFDVEEWFAPETDLLALDRRVHRAQDEAEASSAQLSFQITAARDPELRFSAARQILTRYQRLFPRHNAASGSERFARAFSRHRALHDRRKALVRADYEHSLDVWQWVLRLAPDASLALQLAALFHDIERLTSEADARIEQHAPDYVGYKLRHAQVGGALTRAALDGVGLDADTTREVIMLVTRHEQPDGDAALAVLNDADALSFFALNAAGFVAYYGPEHTETKVRYTWRRMSPWARALLDEVRLLPAIERALRPLRAPKTRAP